MGTIPQSEETGQIYIQEITNTHKKDTVQIGKLTLKPLSKIYSDTRVGYNKPWERHEGIMSQIMSTQIFPKWKQ